MSSTPLKLGFVLTAIDKATSVVVKVAKNIDKLAEPARRIGRAFGIVREQLGGVAAVGLRLGVVAGAASVAVGRVTSQLDQLGDTADNIGVTTTRLQELRFALEAAGGDGGQLDEVLTRLNSNIGEAVNGNKEMAEWFGAVGISMRQLRESSPDEVLDLITEFVHRLPETARNTATLGQFAQAVFGRGGKTMLSFLRLGKAGLRAYADEAHRAGAIVGEDAVEAFGEFNNVLARSKATLFSALATALKPTLPTLTQLLDRLGQLVVVNKDLIATRLDRFFKRVEEGLPGLLKEVDDVWEAIKRVAQAADACAQAVGGWGNALLLLIGMKAASVVLGIASAVGVLNVAMWANPIGVLLGVVLLIVAALPLMIRHWDTIIEKLWEVRSVVEQVFPKWLIDLNDKFLPSWAMPRPEGSWEAPTVGPAAAAGRTEVGGTLKIQIDQEGRAKTVALQKAPGSPMDLDVAYTGAPLALPL